MLSLIAVVFSTVLIPAPTLVVAHSAPSIQSQQKQANLTIGPFATPDFSITANPTTLTLSAGQSMTVTLTVQSLNNFAGTVYLSSTGLLVNAALNPSNLTLAARLSATSTLTVTATSDTAPGIGEASVDAVSPCTLEHFAHVSVKVTGPDFTIAAAKTHLTASSSTTDSSVINLASIDGFSGTVSLSVSAAAQLFGIAFTSTTVGLNPGGSGSTTVTVQPKSTTLPGDYQISIDATSGILAHSTVLLVTVTGATGKTFDLTPPGISLTVAQGGMNSSGVITVTPVDGFTGTVTLISSPSFPPGLTATLNPSSIVLGAAQTSALTVTAPSTLNPGSYFLRIDGTSGSIHQTVFVGVYVKGPDFEVTTDPLSPLTIVAGHTCTSTLTVAPIDGFSSAVSLSAKAPTGLTTSFSSTKINPPPGTSILSIGASSTMAPGPYIVEVNATTTGTLFHTALVFVTVIGPTFELTASPTSLTVKAGGATTMSLIGLSPENGFTGTVTVIATAFGAGLSATLSSPTIMGTGTSTLMVIAATGTAPGTLYLVEVLGTSGSLSFTLYIDLTVTGPDFTLSATPSPVTFNSGTTTTSTVTLTTSGGFSDPVELFVGSPFNLNATINPSIVTSGSYSATLSLNSTIPGLYSVDIFARDQSNGLFHDLTIQVVVNGPGYSVIATPSMVNVAAGSHGTASITIQPIRGFSDSVSLSPVFPPTGITALPSPSAISPGQTSTLTITVDPTLTAGPYILDIQGISGSLTNNTLITVDVSDFTVTMTTPTSAAAGGTSMAKSTVTVNDVNAFTGSIDLTYTSATAGILCTFAPPTIVNSGTSTISCTSTTVNSYQVTVNGTSGSLTHTAAAATFTFGADFAISATSPPPVEADGQTSASSTIMVNYLNGFHGTAYLSTTEFSALSCTLTPQSLASTGTANLSCTSSTAGTYAVTIIGEIIYVPPHGMPVIQFTTDTSATFTFSPQRTGSYSVSSDHGALSIQQGSSGTATITVTPSGGFSDSVYLTTVVSPMGLVTSLSVSTIMGGSGTSILTINVPPTLNTGTYYVSVTGASGMQSHGITINLTVTTPEPAATAPPSPALVYGIVGVAVVAIAVGGSMLYLRSRKLSKSAKPANNPK